METGQSFAPILIILSIAVAVLYLHLTGGSGKTRLYLAALLTAVALLLLVPSFDTSLPQWWSGYLPTPRIQLGLDLQGGTHLLLGVKLDDAVKTQLRRRGDDLKTELTQNKTPFDSIDLNSSGALVVKLKSADERDAFLNLMQQSAPDLTISSISSPDAPAYALNFKPQQIAETERNAMDQAVETIRNRIDQLGVRETTVMREGSDEILVQLPGIQDPERAKELIGKTAVLEFKLVDDSHSVADALKNGPPPGDEILYGPPQPGGRTP